MTTQQPLLVIEIPNYIREVKIANSRRPIYYNYERGVIVSTAKIKSNMLIPAAKAKVTAYPTINLSAIDLNSAYTIGVFTPNGLVDYVVDKTTMTTLRGKVLNTPLKATTKLKVIHTTTKEAVIANSKVAGTPKFKIINGQDIYNGAVNEHLRAFIMRAIKIDMVQHITSLPVISPLPMFLEMEIHDVIGKGDWDIENRAMPYCKAFSDLIRSGVLKDGKKEIKFFNPFMKDDNVLHLTRSGGATFFPINDTNNRRLIFKFYEDTRDCIKNNPHYKSYYSNNGTTTNHGVQPTLFPNC